MIIPLILLSLFSCTPELKYKGDQICYDKCLERGLYVAEDTENVCRCADLTLKDR
jgi:hypothetical protein